MTLYLIKDTNLRIGEYGKCPSFHILDHRTHRTARPLPSEMLHYARSDTHFLLYIYDNLRNALIDRADGQPMLLRTVLEKSESTALQLYEEEIYDYENGFGTGGWDTLAKKWNRPMTGLQMAVFRSVHGWRDKVAREEDESTR